MGDARAIKGAYDVIIANINRNILISDLPSYAAALNSGGHLLLSGFYVEDRQTLIDLGASLGLHYQEEREKERWVAMRLSMV